MCEIRLKNFNMRTVEEDDADFIVALRTNENLAKHLHSTPPDIEAQKAWIRAYKEREREKKEFYFIAETYNGEKLGLNRLYNFDQDAFEIGSWIFKRGLPESTPIIADIATRDFAFEQLQFNKCKFNVRKENKSVVRYHQLFKPKLIGDDELNYYYELDFDTYSFYRQKILKLINHG